MRRVVGIKEAAKHTGLAEWNLRQGAKAGLYPHMRAGGEKGTFLFDLELLNDAITRHMLSNMAYDDADRSGTIRPIALVK